MFKEDIFWRHILDDSKWWNKCILTVDVGFGLFHEDVFEWLLTTWKKNPNSLFITWIIKQVFLFKVLITCMFVTSLYCLKLNAQFSVSTQNMKKSYVFLCKINIPPAPPSPYHPEQNGTLWLTPCNLVEKARSAHNINLTNIFLFYFVRETPELYL